MERHGVGFMIHAKLLPHLEDITPVSGRLSILQIRGPTPTVLASAYAPTADSTVDEKHKFYDLLAEHLGKIKGKSTLVIAGDFNARLYSRMDLDPTLVGPHILQHEQEVIPRNQQTLESRDLFHDFCLCQGLNIRNTWFEAPQKKLATLRNIGVTETPPL